MVVMEIIESIQNDLKWHSKELKPKYKKDLEMAIELLENQISKKPYIEEHDYGEAYVCASCDTFLHYVDDEEEHLRFNYCPKCGQKLEV